MGCSDGFGRRSPRLGSSSLGEALGCYRSTLVAVHVPRADRPRLRDTLALRRGDLPIVQNRTSSPEDSSIAVAYATPTDSENAKN